MGRVVVLPARRVAYTTSFGHPSTSDAFARLEQVVPLKGNRFYATYDASTQEYRACVALRMPRNSCSGSIVTTALDRLEQLLGISRCGQS